MMQLRIWGRREREDVRKQLLERSCITRHNHLNPRAVQFKTNQVSIIEQGRKLAIAYGPNSHSSSLPPS